MSLNPGYIISLVVAVFLASCGTTATTIFRANFQSETIGSPPSTNPIGDPDVEGDSIRYYPSCPSSPCNVEVNEWKDVRTAKAVHVYSRVDGFTGLRAFPAVSGDPRGVFYTLTFKMYLKQGQRLSVPEINEYDFFVRAHFYEGAESDRFAEIKFSNGQVFVFNGTGFVAFEDITYEKDIEFVIFMILNFELEQYSIMISAPGSHGGTNTISDVPMFGSMSTVKPHFSFGFDGTYSGIPDNADIFVIDDITVIRHDREESPGK
ncbi:MAG TPA: hypothetical protein VKO63_10470 [Chitinispirillaceae bacterium]|nr:hypothetical protein [Chitinispirillaceae bacterium]